MDEATGSVALYRDLGVVALTIHIHGHVEGWRRTVVVFDEVLTTDGPIPTATRMTIVAAKEAQGAIASFDAVCGEDTCRIETVYFNE